MLLCANFISRDDRNKKIMSKIKILSFFVFGFLLFAYLNYFSDIVMPWQEKEIVETTLFWGGLDELPTSAALVNIEKRGSMFTRQFIIEFIATKEDIAKWRNTSKRLKNKLSKTNLKTAIFEIYPGENGAMGGTVEIEGNKVKINISWN